MKQESDDVEWITINGNHIPIKQGEDKQDAVDNFLLRTTPKHSSDVASIFAKLSDKKQIEILKKAGFDDKRINSLKGSGMIISYSNAPDKIVMGWSVDTERKVLRAMGGK